MTFTNNDTVGSFTDMWYLLHFKEKVDNSASFLPQGVLETFAVILWRFSVAIAKLSIYQVHAKVRVNNRQYPSANFPKTTNFLSCIAHVIWRGATLNLAADRARNQHTFISDAAAVKTWLTLMHCEQRQRHRITSLAFGESTVNGRTEQFVGHSIRRAVFPVRVSEIFAHIEVLESLCLWGLETLATHWTGTQ